MPETAYVHYQPLAEESAADGAFGADPFWVDMEPERLAVVASELPEDELLQVRAERLIRRAAAMAVEAAADTDTSPSRYHSLLEAAQAAAEGDLEAVMAVRANVRTDVIERSIKAGHVMEVELQTDEEGRILQYGQYMEDVHLNSLRYAAHGWQMRERTEAETRNAMRIEHHNRFGRLEDHYFVVLSRAADNMSRQEMQDAGFFDTMSMAIQVTHVDDGQLKTESAFVAGVAAGSDRQTTSQLVIEVPVRETERHDALMVEAIGAQFGADLSGKSAAEILDMPLLIPKELLPDGILDLVRIADDAAGTFFGQDKPREGYRQYREKCRRREAELEPTVDRIVAELLDAAPDLQTPDDAAAKLHEFSEKLLVKRSLTDRRIDPRVFGGVSAQHIYAARQQLEMGDVAGAGVSMDRAVRTAVSSSCPTGRNSQNNFGKNGESDPADKESEGPGGKVWMKCPFCAEPKFEDPCAKILECRKCHAKVVDGQLVNKGGARAEHKVQYLELAREYAMKRRKAEEERVQTRVESAARKAEKQAAMAA